MADIDATLSRFEAWRAGPQVPDPELELAMHGVASRCEDRGHLDRLLAALSEASQVAERVESVLLSSWTFEQGRLTGVPVGRTDSELVALAESEVAAIIQRARQQLHPAKPEHVDLFGRLSDLPIVLVDSRTTKCVGFQVRSGGVIGLQAENAGAPFTLDELDEMAEVHMAQPLYAESVPGGTYERLAFKDVVEDNTYLPRWIFALATAGAISTQAMHDLWESGADLWIEPDRIVVATQCSAQPGTVYSAGPPSSGSSTREVEPWAAAAGPGGQRALDLAAKGLAEGASDGVVRLSLDELSLPSLPPVHDPGAFTSLAIASNPGIDLSSLVDFTGLDRLFLTNCQLAAVPDGVAQLSGLRILQLNNNAITELSPRTIADLGLLEELYLVRNQLTELPVELGSLRSLRNLKLAQNALTSLPNWIGSLANLGARSSSQCDQLDPSRTRPAPELERTGPRSEPNRITAAGSARPSGNLSASPARYWPAGTPRDES